MDQRPATSKPISSDKATSIVRRWKNEQLTKTTARTFRESDDFPIVCSLIRSTGAQLCKTLSKASSPGNDNEIRAWYTTLLDAVRLIANVAHLDLECRLAIKKYGIVLQLGLLLEEKRLQLDLAAAIIRLLANVCESKESAIFVLQTKPCVAVVLRWLTGDLETTKLSLVQKIREHCVRFLRNAAVCSNNLARFLIRCDACYAAGRCLASSDENDSISTTSRDKVVQFLRTALLLKDHGCAEQLLRAGLSEKLMNWILNKTVCESLVQQAEQLLLLMTYYSDLRIDLAKFGAVGFLQQRIESMLDSQESDSNQDAVDKSTLKSEWLISLTRFCGDAYTRVKLRESGALNLLLRMFEDRKADTKFLNELMSAFLCFLYDDQGLKHLVEYESFLGTVVHTIASFTDAHRCSAIHFNASVTSVTDQGISESDMEQGNERSASTVAEEFLREFRPDSPSYKRCRFEIVGDVGGATGDDRQQMPLCKDFLGNSDFTPPVSPSRSLGPSWSPSASSFNSFSSCGSFSPPASVASSTKCLSLFSDSESDCQEWFESVSKRPSDSSTSSLVAFCTCERDNSDSFRERENLIHSAVKLLSWLSHGVHAGVLINANVLQVLAAYIGGVCRPEPKIGRLIERLIRNRIFTESLLSLEFYRTIHETLCTPKCQNPESFCNRCRKMKQIGLSILRGFSAQVDSDYGTGTLTHMISTKEEKCKQMAYCAIPYLMRNNWRKHQLMKGSQGGISWMAKEIIAIDGSYEIQLAVIKALYAGTEKNSVRRRLTDSFAHSPTNPNCKFMQMNDDNNEQKVTFRESGNDERHITCNLRTLTEESPFYRTMFAGPFAESTQREFRLDNSEFNSCLNYIHFIHGCNGCESMVANPTVCLTSLDFADKHCCSKFGDFVVGWLTPKFLRSENVIDFVVSAVVHRLTDLFRICLDYAMLCMTAEDLLALLKEVGDGNFREDLGRFFGDYVQQGI